MQLLTPLLSLAASAIAEGIKTTQEYFVHKEPLPCKLLLQLLRTQPCPTRDLKTPSQRCPYRPASDGTGGSDRGDSPAAKPSPLSNSFPEVPAL